MAHELPELPYAKDALEPHISAETLDYHHDKHHAAYVTNLNNLIPGTEFEKMSLEDIVKKAPGRRHLQQRRPGLEPHLLLQRHGPQGRRRAHRCDRPRRSTRPSARFAEFKEKFSKSAATNFGSGWTWLVKKSKGGLEIVNTHDADSAGQDGHADPDHRRVGARLLRGQAQRAAGLHRVLVESRELGFRDQELRRLD